MQTMWNYTTTPSPSDSNAVIIRDLTREQATVMSNISFGVSIPAFLCSLPVIWVLRLHCKSFVCQKCCYNPFRPGRQPPIPTESDVVLSIILCLQFSDMMFALGFLLTPLNDTNVICTLQGIILQLFGPCSMILSMCLSFELLIVIRSILHNRTTYITGLHRLYVYCSLSTIVSIFFLIADDISNGYGRDDTTDPQEIAWCWVKTQDSFSFFSYYGVATIVFFIVFICYSLVLYEIIHKIKNLNNTDTNERMIQSLWRTFAKVGVYPILMLITLLPGLIHRLPSLFGKHVKSNAIDVYNETTMKYLHAGTMPLLGLIDAIILASGNNHVRNRLVGCVKCQRNDTKSDRKEWKRRRSSGVSRRVLDEAFSKDDDEDDEIAMLRWSDDDDDLIDADSWWNENDGDVGLLHIGGSGKYNHGSLREGNGSMAEDIIDYQLSSSMSSTLSSTYNPNNQPMHPSSLGSSGGNWKKQENNEDESAPSF
jgi:hypothetical protein